MSGTKESNVRDEERRGWNPVSLAAMIVSVCALFVSVCALVVTVWQLLETHKHNRLALRPVLRSTVSESTFSIKLTNAGIGPAHVTNMVLFVGGKRISASKTPSARDWTEFFETLKLNELCFRTTSLQDSWLLPKEEVSLIEPSTGGGPDECSRDKLGLFAQLDKIDVIIEYESPYGEEFKFDFLPPDMSRSVDPAKLRELENRRRALDRIEEGG